MGGYIYKGLVAGSMALRDRLYGKPPKGLGGKQGDVYILKKSFLAIAADAGGLWRKLAWSRSTGESLRQQAGDVCTGLGGRGRREKKIDGSVWWYTPVILVLGRWPDCLGQWRELASNNRGLGIQVGGGGLAWHTLGWVPRTGWCQWGGHV